MIDDKSDVRWALNAEHAARLKVGDGSGMCNSWEKLLPTRNGLYAAAHTNPHHHANTKEWTA
jgi:hypothetical protein